MAEHPIPFRTLHEDCYLIGTSDSDQAALLIRPDATLIALHAALRSRVVTLHQLIGQWARVNDPDISVTAADLAGVLWPMAEEVDALAERLGATLGKAAIAHDPDRSPFTPG